MFAHYLGTPYLDDVMSQNELTTAMYKKKIRTFFPEDVPQHFLVLSRIRIPWKLLTQN